MHLNELQQVIRFGVSQLSALNGQADFEKICLYFSRARIHKNILPATGPVQAGGDQGRDFETFHSYLSSSSIGTSSFIGMFSDYPVAFACSLEKEPTKKNGKIYSDVKTITASGSKVERIYFFSGGDIPVAKRHKCQQEIADEFKTNLEIIDAQAISQHLADRDLFWIAIQFLKIPSEYYPKEKEDAWYSNLMEEYKNRIKIPNTFEEFSDIKGAIRKIYKSDTLKSDLFFWLPKLDSIIKDSFLPNFLKRKAIYEKFVASLIGLDNVEDQENNINEYYNDFEKYTSVGELEDAQILLSFCLNSRRLNRHNLTLEYLVDIANRFETLILKRINQVENIDTRCALIEIHANFILHDHRNDASFGDNMQQYIAKLNEILPLLPDSHFFPLERFSDKLNGIIEILFDVSLETDSIEEFVSKIDEVLATKAGGGVVADKLRDRAISYLNRKETFKAIKTLHDLKIKWYNQDTLKGCILSCLLLADAYRQLNLFYAAKYYAFVGSYLAINSNDEEISTYFVRGLSTAASCDYSTGSWLSFLTLIDLLVISHYQITKDFDVYKHADTHHILFYTPLVVESAEVVFPEIRDLIDAIIKKWGFIWDDIKEIGEKVRKEFNLRDKQEHLKFLESKLYGVPFNDIGERRTIIFNASGCDWYFTFNNDYETNAIAEEFVSMFQIILADLNTEDLHVIQSKVSVELTRIFKSKAKFNRLPSNDESLWVVKLPTFSGLALAELHEHEFQYLIIAQALIYEVSLLPSNEYYALMSNKFRNGSLVNKATFGRPYEDLYYHMISRNDFISSKRWTFVNSISFDRYKPRTNEKMQWRESLSPKYSSDQILKIINNRIINSQKPLSITFPALKRSPNFQRIVTSLRNKGWLDWHILQSIANIVVNYKAQLRERPKNAEELQSIFFKYFLKDEVDWFQMIPETLLSEERINLELELMLPITVLRSFGLEFHSETPNQKAIINLLKQRFKFFEDGKQNIIF